MDKTTQRRESIWMGYLIGPAFFLLAAWFLWGASPHDEAIPEGVTVAPELLSTAPRRSILGDPPLVTLGGFERTCNDCHQMFPTRQGDAPIQLMQHNHIQLDHGINDRCHNCHYTEDHNLLVLRGGRVIKYGNVVELCAKCHGPTYRDWQRGAHGRTNGFWDATAGTVRRLVCTECHDPHRPRHPAMDPVAPLPGPQKMHAGPPPDEEDHDNGRHDPLDWHGNR